MSDLYVTGLPLKVANYIAKRCGVPALYPGHYGDLKIEYVLFVVYSEASDEKVMVIKTNQWRRGCLINAEYHVSALVNLPPDDALFDLFKKYRSFPNAYPGLSFEYEYHEIVLLFPGGTISHDISNARYGNDVTFHSDNGDGWLSFTLYEAYEALLKQLKERLANPATYALPPVKYRELPGVDFDKDIDSFVSRHQYMTIFEQSGVFNGADAPHDTLYMLEVSNQNMTVLIIKTRRYFRGVSFHNVYHPEQDVIFDLEEPEIDWRSVIEAVHDDTLDTRDKDVFQIVLMLENEDVYAYFKEPKDFDLAVHKNMITLLEALMTIFDAFPEFSA